VIAEGAKFLVPLGVFEMFIRVVLTAASVAALATAANAADLSGGRDAPYARVTWNGVYAGVNGGYGVGNAVEGTVYQDAGNYSSASITPSGGFGGGQVGFNWQSGGFVAGVEADFQAGGLTGAATTPLTAGNTATVDSSLDWFGSVRGRVGYSFGSTLLYGTGGFAFGGVHDQFKVSSSSKAYDSNSTATGYVAGAGLEYAFNSSWSAKAEYQYIDLGTNTVKETIGSGPAYGAGAFDHTYNTVSVGLNYHIGRGW
jgi:outer membrane immunogenic protein